MWPFTKRKYFSASLSDESMWIDTSETTADKALTLSAIFGAVYAITSTISTLPVHVKRRNSDGTTDTATDHPISSLLANPNPYLTTSDLISFLVWSTETNGNGFLEIVRAGGRIVALWPLDSNKISVRTLGRDIVYEHQDGLGKKVFNPEELIHNRFVTNSANPMSLSPLQYAYKTNRLSLSGREYGQRILTSGGAKRLVASGPYDATRDEAAIKTALTALKNAFTGEANMGTIAYTGAMELKEIGIPPEDAQLIELMKMTALDVCRFWRIQPHKLQILDNSGYNNAEQQGIEFKQDTILPRVVKIEQVLNRAFFADTPEYYIKFNLNGLERGDIQTRMASYATAIQWGFMNRNEVRSLEDMNPFEGGDTYERPLNMTPINESGETPNDGDDDDV